MKPCTHSEIFKLAVSNMGQCQVCRSEELADLRKENDRLKFQVKALLKANEEAEEVLHNEYCVKTKDGECADACNGLVEARRGASYVLAELTKGEG